MHDNTSPPQKYLLIPSAFTTETKKKKTSRGILGFGGQGLSIPMQVRWSNGRVFHERMGLIPLQSHSLLVTALSSWLCGVPEQMKSLVFNLIPNKISRTVPNLRFDWKPASVEIYGQLALEQSIPLQLTWSHVVQKVVSKANPGTKQKVKISLFHYMD